MVLDDLFQPCLRVRARNQDILIHMKCEPHEFFLTNDSRRGNSLHTLLYERLEKCELLRIHDFFEIRIEEDPLLVKNLRKQELCVQTRRLDLVILEILRRPCEQALDRPERISGHSLPLLSCGAPDPLPSAGQGSRPCSHS